jgi:hypothetical protein
MATREHRLSEFSHEAPPLNTPLELLCEDHAGTYVLPYACVWSGTAWQNAATITAIEARVLGWRPRH